MIGQRLKSLNSITSSTDKIDDLPVDGLDGVEDSLSYIVDEIHRHLHNWESWFGAAVVPNGSIHAADRIGVGVSEFQIDAGNNDWGTWVAILGSSDTPTRTGNVKYDAHRILITNVERTNEHYFVQFGIGPSGASALTANTYTEFVFEIASGASRETPIDIIMKRGDAGDILWARCMVPGQNTGTMDFFMGVHEYEG